MIRRDTTTSSDPDWNETELISYEQDDQVISTRELDPHVFPDEVDWTTRHALSGAYDLPRRGRGLEKLLRHMNRGREARVGPPIESRLFSRAFSCPTARCFTGGDSKVLVTLGALATYQP